MKKFMALLKKSKRRIRTNVSQISKTVKIPAESAIWYQLSPQKKISTWEKFSVGGCGTRGFSAQWDTKIESVDFIRQYRGIRREEEVLGRRSTYFPLQVPLEEVS